MLVYPGKISLYCFAFAICSIIFVLFKYFGELYIKRSLTVDVICLVIAYFVIVNIVLRLLLKDLLYQVAVRAAFLGGIFSCGLLVIILAPGSYRVFGGYVCVLSFFHYSEFLSIALSNPETLSIDSYILDHSLDYKIAAVASWVEFFIERYFYPDLKVFWWISCVGLLLCITGEILRKAAILTARSGFTHTVQKKRKSNHTLVTNGVYAWTRHPSYVGWFYWAIGTQIILVNPVCVIAYALASWKFFHDRIFVEESTLLSFFGEEYIQYQKKVPTRLPFIKGYLLENRQT